jgi:ectoine hydroxylase-related dioxygenase (phytanoyl-CoA dioxygenase family)
MAHASTALRAQIEENGYVVVPDAVPRQNLDAVIADIWRHTGASPGDRETWYQPRLVAPTGMVEMYHYQSLWDNRQHPRVHAIFGEILGTERLWVTLDRANLKPPADPRHPNYDHKGFIHWDVDVSTYPEVPFGVQGVLALADTDEEMGGFQCVPELYRDLETWLAARAGQGITRRPDLDGYTITRVPLQAGAMVIWSTLLPHGNGHNTSDRPRLAQYISMGPAREDDEEARRTRIRCWEQRLPPPAPAFPGDPRHIEEREGQPALLTPLGRRLLGLDRWA